MIRGGFTAHIFAQTRSTLAGSHQSGVLLLGGVLTVARDWNRFSLSERRRPYRPCLRSA